MKDRTGIAAAIGLGVVITITTAVVLLSSGADRGQIDHGSASAKAGAIGR